MVTQGNPLSDTAEKATAVVSHEHHADELQHVVHALNSKERLSAYFTILAAAFGLISDGCEYIVPSDVAIPSSRWRIRRSEQYYDHVQRMAYIHALRNILILNISNRLYSKNCIQRSTLQQYQLGFLILYSLASCFFSSHAISITVVDC
jgi:hypothetical protein